MSVEHWIGIATLVMNGVLIIFVVGAYKGKKDHEGEDHGEKLRELQKCIDDLEHRFEEERKRRDYHKLKNVLTGIMVQLAIIRTKLGLPEPHAMPEEM